VARRENAALTDVLLLMVSPGCLEADGFQPSSTSRVFRVQRGTSCRHHAVMKEAIEHQRGSISKTTRRPDDAFGEVASRLFEAFPCEGPAA